MQNIKQTVKGSKLILEIDLKAKPTLSESGKFQVVASSRWDKVTGKDVPEGFVISVMAGYSAKAARTGK